MKYCASFLARLNQFIPPPDEKRHSITLDEDKFTIQVSIWIDDLHCVPVWLDERDLAMSPAALAASLVRLIKNAKAEAERPTS